MRSSVELLASTTRVDPPGSEDVLVFDYNNLVGQIQYRTHMSGCEADAVADSQ
jgi:hypothetical protein